MNSEFQLTKRLLKDFESLDLPKGRRKTGLFVAEGSKCVLDLLPAFKCRYLFASPQWMQEHQGVTADEIVEASPSMLRQLTRLSTPSPVIAFFELPDNTEAPDAQYVIGNLTLVLDRVQDPGNLGTIIRCADWMGVRRIVASRDTVDAFSPKCVQATMGALARVAVAYVELDEYLASVKGANVYGTFLGGDNIYTSPLSKGGLLVMGNEGSGISNAVAHHVTHRLTIPPYPIDAQTSESLNVGVATAIALSQFRARLFE